MAGLKAVAILGSIGVLAPILVILASVIQPESEIWRHIVGTLLNDMVKNTAILCAGVSFGTLAIGVSAAWLTALCEFPGRSVLNWALMLPLAVPTYVLAFVFIGLFDFSGPVQTYLRMQWGGALPWFPNIRSAAGVTLVLSLALYPYVYLLARNAFKTQGKSVLEVSRALGHRPANAFFKAALPMARPWISGGLMLVLMETLADFGAVSIFNYDTFTTGIYKAWFGFFSLNAAAQLSSLLLAVVFLIVIIEQRMRNKMQFHQLGRPSMDTGRIRLQGWQKWVACGVLTAVVAVAFVVPCFQLIVWSVKSITVEFDSSYIGLLFRSLLLSTIAAAVITGGGLLLAYIQRRHSDAMTQWIIRLSTMGYALPGTVLAVGVVIMVNAADKPLLWAVATLTGLQPASILSGTIVTVLFAYTVRFLTAGYSGISSAMMRITKNLDEAAALMGVTDMALLRRVHLPILKNGLLMAAMLVFVDVMKEMPITLMTRPFGWDTLAVKIFELTSEGEWQRAAFPSITLVLAGLPPLVFLNRKSEQTDL